MRVNFSYIGQICLAFHRQKVTLDKLFDDAKIAQQAYEWDKVLSITDRILTMRECNEAALSLKRYAEDAKDHDLAIQSYAQAKTAFETELSKSEPSSVGRASSRAALLAAHGGATWSVVKRLRTVGAASANDPVAGEKAYRYALSALPSAVNEAVAAEKVDAALTSARQAKAAGQWQSCIDKAGEALALETGHAEAAALKKEAEGNLVPTLTVEVEAGGRAVAAEISDGTRTYRAPHTFTLKPDGRYGFVVSMESKESNQSIRAKRYKPEKLEVTADWQGSKTRRVALEEVRGPPEGQPWASPASGMEFVWVPAMKVWVGKYEVTNGEYRKKEPGHDSKDYMGHGLNGERQPVVYVDFDDAKTYAVWLTGRDRDKLEGLRYRVISEKEWETVAQCGERRYYPWGNAMPPKYGNYSDSASALRSKISGYTDGFAVTCPVERSGANEWGLYGIGGNVWECCASDVTGVSFGAWRGASWRCEEPGLLRIVFRDGEVGLDRDGSGGFRLVLSR